MQFTYKHIHAWIDRNLPYIILISIYNGKARNYLKRVDHHFTSLFSSSLSSAILLLSSLYHFKTQIHKMLSRSASRFFNNRHRALTLGVMATAATGGAFFLTSDSKKVVAHAESNNQLKFWNSLPGENTPENPGFAKLRGMAAEQRFRTSLAQSNGKTDFDVVIGKFFRFYTYLSKHKSM